MSARTDAIIRDLQRIDEIVSSAGVSAEQLAERLAERDMLVRQLAEANAALNSKPLLKG
jgi:ribosome-binding protein aMBF1 (putative translation factor)